MFSAGDSSSFHGGEFIGLLLGGYRAYFGISGKQESGADPCFSRRFRSSPADLAPRPPGSGCVPGRWTSRGSFISPFAVSVSCGSLQSFAATGFRRAMDSRRSFPAVAGDARRRRSRIHRGSRGLVVIFMFSRGLCVKRMVEQVYSVSYLCLHVCVCVWVFVPYISV